MTALTALALTVSGLAAAAPAEAVQQTMETMTLDGSTTQQGRLTRDSVASTCGSAKDYPGQFSPAVGYNYRTATVVAAQSGCLTVVRTAASCIGDVTNPDSLNVHLSIYQGSYDPAHPEVGYLGDQGGSVNANNIAVDVEAGATYVLVATNTSSPATCSIDVTLRYPVDTTITGGPSGAVNQQPSFTFVGTADASAFQCRLDGAPYTTCTSPFTPTVAEGAHTVRIRARDAGSAVDPSPATRTFTYDVTAPDTEIAGGPAKVRADEATFGVAGTPSADVVGFECELDGAAFAACGPTVRLASLSVGSHTLQARAVDAAGNQDTTPAVRTFLSCNLAGATLDLQKASAALSRADKSVVKAKKAVAKAHGAQRKKAKKKLAKSTRAARKAKRKVAGLQKGIFACAR